MFRGICAIALGSLLYACGAADPAAPEASPPARLLLRLGAESVTVDQWGMVTVPVTVSRTFTQGDVSLRAEKLPAGVSATFKPGFLPFPAQGSELVLHGVHAPVNGVVTIRASTPDAQTSAELRFEVRARPVSLSMEWSETGGIAGLYLPPLRVRARMPDGRVPENFHVPVTVSLRHPVNDADLRENTGTISGNGEITFRHLTVSTPGRDYSLVVHAAGLADLAGPVFEVTDGGSIAFVSDRQGGPHLYIMGADGSYVRQLTSGAVADSDPAWSPDGRRIAFARAGLGVFVIEADGTRLQRVGNGRQPAWSPDGRQLAVSNNGMIQLLAVDTDSPPVTIAIPPAFLTLEEPAWASDGRTIAFVHDWITEGRYVVAVTLGGGAWQRPEYLASGVQVEGSPVWSQDGHRLLFWRDNDIITAQVNGPEHVLLAGVNSFLGRVAWSPDERKVVFHSGGRPDALFPRPPSQIRIADADGRGAVQEITMPGRNYQPAWTHRR